MNAHVICCNDAVEFVVTGDYHRAEIKKEELADAYYRENKHNWRSYKKYREQCYWHFHTVEII